MARKTKKKPVISASKKRKMVRISKAENTKRLKIINKMADDIQKKSGSSVKVVKVKTFKKKRKDALKEAGKRYVKEHKK